MASAASVAPVSHICRLGLLHTHCVWNEVKAWSKLGSIVPISHMFPLPCLKMSKNPPVAYSLGAWLMRRRHRKGKATAVVISAGFRLGDALDMAADVYHGVSPS
jgi:hypothetical protein